MFLVFSMLCFVFKCFWIVNSVGKILFKRLWFDFLINIDIKDDNEIIEIEDVLFIEVINEENKDINNEYSEDLVFN